ncbi:hypothetical protein CPB84DRAFT_1753314 [Gymnopilus junonius]|uniref:Uncharacterized protein n=1 Tax=Gymnopilus junonius TaxID=109634 RepID=A0A9P5TG19_GYMJU|nr:hypothetical protein CPB84DRAFT_1753314 [Gymnopilus junonius]
MVLFMQCFLIHVVAAEWWHKHSWGTIDQNSMVARRHCETVFAAGLACTRSKIAYSEGAKSTICQARLMKSQSQGSPAIGNGIAAGDQGCMGYAMHGQCLAVQQSQEQEYPTSCSNQACQVFASFLPLVKTVQQCPCEALPQLQISLHLGGGKGEDNGGGYRLNGKGDGDITAEVTALFFLGLFPVDPAVIPGHQQLKRIWIKQIVLCAL